MKEAWGFWLSLFLVILIMFMFNGCASKVEYVDRIVKVNVPVRCISPDVNKSVQGKNDAESLLGIIRERDELREANLACK